MRGKKELRYILVNNGHILIFNGRLRMLGAQLAQDYAYMQMNVI